MSKACDSPQSAESSDVKLGYCLEERYVENSFKRKESNIEENCMYSEEQPDTESIKILKTKVNGNEESNMNKQDPEELEARLDLSEASGSKELINDSCACEQRSDSDVNSFDNNSAVASCSTTSTEYGNSLSKKRKELRLYEDQLRTLVPGATDLSRLDLIHSTIDYISDLEEALEARVKKRLCRDVRSRPPLTQLPGYSETGSATKVTSEAVKSNLTTNMSSDKSNKTDGKDINVMQKIREAFLCFNDNDFAESKMITSKKETIGHCPICSKIRSTSATKARNQHAN